MSNESALRIHFVEEHIPTGVPDENSSPIRAAAMKFTTAGDAPRRAERQHCPDKVPPTYLPHNFSRKSRWVFFLTSARLGVFFPRSVILNQVTTRYCAQHLSMFLRGCPVGLVGCWMSLAWPAQTAHSQPTTGQISPIDSKMRQGPKRPTLDIPRHCICTAQYDPVYGHGPNGRRVTYSNACRAQCDGATEIKRGTC